MIGGDLSVFVAVVAQPYIVKLKPAAFPDHAKFAPQPVMAKQIQVTGAGQHRPVGRRPYIVATQIVERDNRKNDVMLATVAILPLGIGDGLDQG